MIPKQKARAAELQRAPALIIQSYQAPGMIYYQRRNELTEIELELVMSSLRKYH